MTARQRAQLLAKKVEELNAKQATALAAAEAKDVSAEDKAKHFASFDEIQKEKEAAQADYQRWDNLARGQEWIGAPSVRPITQQPFSNPAVTGGLPADAEEAGFNAANIRVPARAKRHGSLVAYKDQEREAYAAGLWFGGALVAYPDQFEFAAACKEKARAMGLDFISNPNAGSPQANLTGLSNQSGGIFVPDVIETKVIELSLAYGVLRRLAEVVPMTSDTITSPRWSTAMIAYWIARGQKPTSSDPAWNAIQLIARDLGAMTKISRQLNEDSLIDLAEKVTINIARAFALAEDSAGFNGDGTSTYGGINGLLTRLAEAGNSACLATATGHTTLSALTNADFTAAEAIAPNYEGADWRWYCHKSAYWNSMAGLGLVAGGNRTDTIAQGPNQRLFHGYPVEFVNAMPSAPGTGTIGFIFADLQRAVKVGDRRGRTVQAGYENDDFTKQLMTILGTERVDVNVHTVKDPLGDANAPGGPVIGLKLG